MGSKCGSIKYERRMLTISLNDINFINIYTSYNIITDPVYFLFTHIYVSLVSEIMKKFVMLQ